MKAFINECSIGSYGDLRTGLQFFWQAALELQRAQVSIYRNSMFFLAPEFARRFNAVTFPNDPLRKLPPDLKSRLREVAFSEKFSRCWRPERLSTETDQYTCGVQNQILCDKSICEAAELKFQEGGADVALLSAADSLYGQSSSVPVTKSVSGAHVELRNVNSLTLISRWIASQRGYYDPASIRAPRDFQTILEKAPDRFQRTDRFWTVGGADRRIYLEGSTGNLFYVDEGHPGPSAHLEVFDADGQHLGEATIDTGILDSSKKDKDKSIIV